MSKAWMVAALLGGAMGLGSHAVQAATTDEKVNELDQKVKVLERKLEIADEDAQAKAKETPVVTASKDGFSIAAPDGSFKLRLRGYIQADGRFYANDKDNKVSDTLLARRVRPIFEGTLYKQFEFRIAPDFGSGSTTIQDAYIDYKPLSLLNFRFGKFKPQQGLEQYQADTDTSFVERGLPSDLEVNRDEGAQVFGNVASNALTYAIGVFNGVPDGANADADTNDGKDLSGRVIAQPFKNSGIDAVSGLGLGISGSAGNEQGSTSSSGLPSYKTVGQQTFFSYASSTNTGANAYANGSHTRISPQAFYYAGPVGIIGEYVRSSQDVKAGSNEATLDNDAWQALASVVLTGEKASYTGITPLAPFDPAHGTWGALELVGRYGELDIDNSAFPKFADPKKSASKVTTWDVGLNWYLNKAVKVAIDYDHSEFDGGASNADRPTEKALLARVQLSY